MAGSRPRTENNVHHGLTEMAISASAGKGRARHKQKGALIEALVHTKTASDAGITTTEADVESERDCLNRKCDACELSQEKKEVSIQGYFFLLSGLRRNNLMNL